MNNVQANFSIPQSCKTKLEQLSAQMGISGSQGLELVLSHLELEADGLPVWADRSQITEALPIARAS